MMFAFIKLVTNLLDVVFGIPSVVFNVMGGLLIIIIVIFGWRVIKAGGT